MKDYLTFWQVSKPVFTYPSDGEDVFLTETLKKVLDRIFLFSKHAGNFVVLTAPAGHGKSSISRYLYHGLPTSSHEVLLISMANEEAKAGWLLPKFMSFFGLPQPEENHTEVIRAEILKRFDDLIEEKKQLVVIIDSADKITSKEGLQDIHAFLGIQALASSCLSFILVASEKLTPLLKSSPLLSRANLVTQIKPLTLNETELYIKSQLKAAGIDEGIFKRPAFKPIHEMSNGIFARINAIAENCLIEACLQGKKLIDATTVQTTSEFVANFEGEGSFFINEKSLATKAKNVKVQPEEKTPETQFASDPNQETKSALRIGKSAQSNAEAEINKKEKESHESKFGKTKPKLEPKKMQPDQQSQDQPIKLKNLFKNNEAG